jgi:hypothetical protein
MTTQPPGAPGAGIGNLVTVGTAVATNISQLVQAFSGLSSAIQGTTSPNSLVTSGYQVFPGGLILNWGTGSTTSGTGSITFSKAFTTSCFGVLLTETGSASATQNNLIASSSPTTTGCNIYCAASASLSLFYVALGH